MTYWLETMKDDVYIVVENGWIADKDLIPKELIINKYFADEKRAIEELENEKDKATGLREEFEEEHSGEEGALEELKNDKGNITKASLRDRIKEIKDDINAKDEIKILNEYMSLTDEESKVAKKIRDEIKKLDKKVEEKYKTLVMEEVKTLVVDGKWMSSIVLEIEGEMERISHRLTSRIIELADRYEKALPQLEEEVNKLSKKAEDHLKKMGF